MAEGQRIDGRHLTSQAEEILNRLVDHLPQLEEQVEPTRVPDWQARLQSMARDIPVIQEKLFLKTQGGTEWSKKALEQVEALDSLVGDGLEGKSVGEATQSVEEAVAKVEEELGGLIEKTKTHIIRMT